jgi:hypothetical protein
MKQDDALWADRLLLDVRQHAEPSEQDATRNLTSIEQRLQLSAQGTAAAARAGDGAAAGAGSLLPLRPVSPQPGSPPPAASAAPLTRATSGGKSAAVLSRWLVFGATSALIGYLGGRTQSRLELAELQRAQQTLQQELQGQAHARAQLEQILQREPQHPVPASPQRQPEPRQERPPSAPRQQRAPAGAPRSAAVAQAQPHSAPSSVVSSAPPNQELREAIELLQRAEAALRQGDAFTASLLLSDLDRSTPPHLLREERLVTRALVGCALGDESSAEVARHELEQLNPASIYRARLEGSCAEKKRVPPPKEPPAPH